MTQKIDPFTLDIIQSSFQAISTEMFYTMQKTSISPIIYEILDMGVALSNPKGELLSSGAGIPAFIGMLDAALQTTIKKFGNMVKPGDMFVTNDPYNGGITHLNDVVLCQPIFYGGVLVAWSANMAHWPDLGGMVPGGISTEATEIFQEGLILPCVKLLENNEPITPVFDIMTANSRMPQNVKGDLWAGIACCRTGEKGIQELIDKYGLGTFKQACDALLENGEKVSLAGLKKLPNQKLEISEEMDDGTLITVKCEITDKEFIVDLRNAPVQRQSPINVSRDGVVVACQMIFKSVTSPETQANAGTYRPLKVLTTEGTIYDPVMPAPCALYYETDIRINDILWRCLSEIAEDKVTAGHFSSICGTFFGGINPDNGQQFTIVEAQVGGWGAGKGMDGTSGMFCCFHGDTFNCPAEIAESRYGGVVVKQLALNDEAGGAGEFRGGKGICLEYQMREDNCWLTVGYSRSIVPPWGLKGGQEGTTNYVNVIRTDGSMEKYHSKSGLILKKGDIIQVNTANGGGYGDPKNRAKHAIEYDLKNGYIQPTEAESVYGYKK